MFIKTLMTFLFVSPVFTWGQTQYVVRKGDTLLKIADRSLGSSDKNDSRRYDLVKKIRTLNPNLKNPNALEPGMTIVIPNEVKPMTVEAKPEVVEKPSTSSATVAPSHEAPQPAPAPTAPAETAQKVEPAVPPPPAPPPAPAQAQPVPEKPHSAEPSKSQENAHHNFFFVQPRYQLLTINTKELATETTATMKSKSSMGLDLQYGVILSSRWHLLFQAGVIQTQFSDIEGDNTPTVNHKSETLSSYAVGIAFEATHSLHMDLLVMQTQRTFLLPATLPDYELEAVSIPGAELSVSWDFYSGEKNIFGISAIAEYIGSLKKDPVEYKATTESIGALYWKSNYRHERVNFKVTVSFKQGHQDTTLTQQKEDLGVLGLGFYF